MTSLMESTVYPIISPANNILQSYNFYLYKNTDSLTLIDAGIDSDPCWEAFMRTLNDNGFSVKDISRIILTHNHGDHSGLVNRICSIVELPVFAHHESIHRLKRDKDYFAMRVGFFEQLYKEMDCEDDGKQHIELLKKRMMTEQHSRIHTDITPLPDHHLDGLQILYTPGHSSDHVALYDATNRRLFSGDFLMQHTSSAAIIEPDQAGNRILSTVQFVQSLRNCSDLEVDVVYPGHGLIFYDFKEITTNRLSRFLKKSQEILELVRSGLTTARQIGLAYYQSRYSQMFGTVISEIIGQLDYLIIEKKVRKELIAGVWNYYPDEDSPNKG